MQSVVSISDATEIAFCSAERVTFDTTGGPQVLQRDMLVRFAKR